MKPAALIESIIAAVVAYQIERNVAPRYILLGRAQQQVLVALSDTFDSTRGERPSLVTLHTG
jgi:hypothetical protein